MRIKIALLLLMQATILLAQSGGEDPIAQNEAQGIQSDKLQKKQQLTPANSSTEQVEKSGKGNIIVNVEVQQNFSMPEPISSKPVVPNGDRESQQTSDGKLQNSELASHKAAGLFSFGPEFMYTAETSNKPIAVFANSAYLGGGLRCGELFGQHNIGLMTKMSLLTTVHSKASSVNITHIADLTEYSLALTYKSAIGFLAKMDISSNDQLFISLGPDAIFHFNNSATMESKSFSLGLMLDLAFKSKLGELSSIVYGADISFNPVNFVNAQPKNGELIYGWIEHSTFIGFNFYLHFGLSY